MPSCSVKWCRSHTDMKNAGLTFHVFPKNEVRRKKWVNAIRLERHDLDWTPTEYSRICSIHFRSHDTYIRKNGKLNRLKKTAVPICTMVGSYAEPTRNVCGSASSTPQELGEPVNTWQRRTPHRARMGHAPETCFKGLGRSDNNPTAEGFATIQLGTNTAR
ncbi:THAP domain-containing protein 2-like [Leptidea sinapis]|uniref:THAP domain-containing protein 2-like n=1 Tax=Leptidea sinapis TaxID=189913 RepID=UPI0021C45EED|nr:THAP domain-containing protein 2-like [Leptidea sinapis]